MHKLLYSHNFIIIDSISMTIQWVSNKNTFIIFNIKLCKVFFAIIKYKTIATKNFKMTNVRFSTFVKFIRGFLKNWSNEHHIKDIVALRTSTQKYFGRDNSLSIVLANSSNYLFFLFTIPFCCGVIVQKNCVEYHCFHKMS